MRPNKTNWLGRVTPSELEELTTLTGTASSSGDNELVATPGAGYRTVVADFVIQNETSTANTMILRSGTTTNGWRFHAEYLGDALAAILPLGQNWELNENEALNLNLSAAAQCGYTIRYRTEVI